MLEDCFSCVSAGNKWEADRCIKTSGGVGGGSTDCGPGYSYSPEKDRCIKAIRKSNPAREACESKGHQWNSETGRCIKLIKKNKLPPAEQAPEQTQTDANTSGGAGGGSENPCGKGWYQAANGQCYPRLN